MPRVNTFPREAQPFPVSLQRNVYSPRLAVRAGDVWRAMQDVVVDHSTSVGWTPERYVASNRMFVVRSMTVRHLEELTFGRAVVGRTWPSGQRRGMFFSREVRLSAGEALVAAASQEWAYLSRDLQLVRAGPEVLAVFHVVEGFPKVTLPAVQETPDTPVHHFDFRTWHLWMDPHAHVNHAAYVDFCDEATSRVLAARGLDPQAMQPVAEHVHFRQPIGPDAAVRVETQLKGAVAPDAAAFSHRIVVGDDVCATVTTVRRLLGRASLDWLDALGR